MLWKIIKNTLLYYIKKKKNIYLNQRERGMHKKGDIFRKECMQCVSRKESLFNSLKCLFMFVYIWFGAYEIILIVRV